MKKWLFSTLVSAFVTPIYIMSINNLFNYKCSYTLKLSIFILCFLFSLFMESLSEAKGDRYD